MSGEAACAHPRLLFRLPLDPARLLRARHRIRDYLNEHGLSPDHVNDIVLATEEAMTNAVRHSGSLRGVEVRLQFEGADLIAEIKDHGHGFDVQRFDPERLPDPLRPSGRGLYLIAHVMDEMRLEQNGGLGVRAVKHDVLDTASAPPGRGLPWHVPGAGICADARQRAMLDDIDEVFLAFDWEYRLVHLNEPASRRIGKSPADLLGLTLWALFPYAEDHVVGEEARQAMQLGRSAVVEHGGGGDGDAWFQTRIYPTSFGISTFTRDITAQRAAQRALEERLRAGEEELEAAERSLQAVLAVLDVALTDRGRGDRDALLETLAQAAVDLGGYEHAAFVLWDGSADGVVDGERAAGLRRAPADDQMGDDVRAALTSGRAAARGNDLLLPLAYGGRTVGYLQLAGAGSASMTPARLAIVRQIAEEATRMAMGALDRAA